MPNIDDVWDGLLPSISVENVWDSLCFTLLICWIMILFANAQATTVFVLCSTVSVESFR